MADPDVIAESYPSANETMEKWATYDAGDLHRKPSLKNLDLDSGIDGEETTIIQFDMHGNVELWTIHEGGHVPELSSSFNRQVIEWLFDHPKAST